MNGRHGADATVPDCRSGEPRPPAEDARSQAAARMSAARPAWLVIWGAYSRRFWAFPRFAAGTLKAGTVEELAGLMARSEQSAQQAARHGFPPAAGRGN